LRGKDFSTLGHGRADIVGLGQQIEATGGGLVEHHLGGRERIHCVGLDVQHRGALTFSGVDIPVGDSACCFEDVGHHRTWQHGLHVDVIVAGQFHLEA